MSSDRDRREEPQAPAPGRGEARVGGKGAQGNRYQPATMTPHQRRAGAQARRHARAGPRPGAKRNAEERRSTEDLASAHEALAQD